MAREPDLEEMLTQAPPDDLGVQGFLDSFAEALTAGNGAAIADLWETPAFVLGDAMVQTIEERGELEQFFSGARNQYNAAGITDTRADIVRLDEISDRIVCVRVRWPYLDADGQELGGETSTYTLRRDDSGEWKIRISVMHGAEAVN